MWGLMNTVASTMRYRRRRSGMGTMTALVVGASVGIAAWETMRRSDWVGGKSQNGTSNNGSSAASAMAEEVMNEIEN